MNYYVPNAIMLQWDMGILKPYQYKTFPTIQETQEFIKNENIQHYTIWKYLMGDKK